MLISIFRCPSCGLVLRPGQPQPPGKHVKCYECGTHFSVPDENAALTPPAPEVAVPTEPGSSAQSRPARDPDPETPQALTRRGPRRRWRSKRSQQSRSLLMGMTVTFGILFVLTIVVVIVLNLTGGFSGLGRGRASRAPVVNANVSRDSFDKLEPGMRLDEVEEMLGSGQRVTLRDLPADAAYTPKSIQAHATDSGAVKFYRWQNGPNDLYAGLGLSRGKREVVVLLAYYFELTARGPGERARVEKVGRASEFE